MFSISKDQIHTQSAHTENPRTWKIRDQWPGIRNRAGFARPHSPAHHGAWSPSVPLQNIFKDSGINTIYANALETDDDDYDISLGVKNN